MWPANEDLTGDCLTAHTEEFAIYLNYVRKLGFEETPDYDFLRELFSKALSKAGETEDNVYDWDLLNGGKGWAAGKVRVKSQTWRGRVLTMLSQLSSNLLAQASRGNEARARPRRATSRDRQRERERAERHAARRDAALKEAQLASGTATPTGTSPAQPPSALINTPGSRMRGNERLSTQRIDSTANAVKGVSLEQHCRRESRQSGSGLVRNKEPAPTSAAIINHPYAATGASNAPAAGTGAYEADDYRGTNSAGGVEMAGRSRTNARTAEGKTSANAAAALQERERRSGTGAPGTAQAEDESRQGGGFSLKKLLTCRCG